MRYIFDLDGTVINSSHRALTKPCGGIDLAHWRENSTAEKIHRDTLLPLADLWRGALRAGHDIVICTSRVMGRADFGFLAKHGLDFHAIISRIGDDARACGAFKREELSRHFSRAELRRSILFDDNHSVLQSVSHLVLRAHDARIINSALASGKHIAL